MFYVIHRCNANKKLQKDVTAEKKKIPATGNFPRSLQSGKQRWQRRLMQQVEGEISAFGSQEVRAEIILLVQTLRSSSP